LKRILNKFKKHPFIYTGALCFLIGFPLGLYIESNEKKNFLFIAYALSLLLVLMPYIIFVTWLFVASPINFFKDKRSFSKKKFKFIGWITIVAVLIIALHGINFVFEEFLGHKHKSTMELLSEA